MLYSSVMTVHEVAGALGVQVAAVVSAQWPPPTGAEPAVAEQAAESAVATVVVGGPGVQGLRVALEGSRRSWPAQVVGLLARGWC